MLDRANVALFSGVSEAQFPCSYTACEIGEQTQTLWDSLSSHRLITSLGRLATKDRLLMTVSTAFPAPTALLHQTF